MQLQDHFASFRTALEHLGASAEEIYENLRSMAGLWLAQGAGLSSSLNVLNCYEILGGNQITPEEAQKRYFDVLQTLLRLLKRFCVMPIIAIIFDTGLNCF